LVKTDRISRLIVRKSNNILGWGEILPFIRFGNYLNGWRVSQKIQHYFCEGDSSIEPIVFINKKCSRFTTVNYGSNRTQWNHKTKKFKCAKGAAAYSFTRQT